MYPLRSSSGSGRNERKMKSFAFGVGPVHSLRRGPTVRIFAVPYFHVIIICNRFRPSHVDDNDNNNACERITSIPFLLLESRDFRFFFWYNQPCDRIDHSMLSIPIYKTVRLTEIYKQKFCRPPDDAGRIAFAFAMQPSIAI